MKYPFLSDDMATEMGEEAWVTDTLATEVTYVGQVIACM